MNVEAFLLCDAATDQMGKLNMLGVFDTIWARQLPVVHPACAIALRMRFEMSEAGGHSVKIRIIDQDGNSAGPKLEGKISVRATEGTDSLASNLILNMQGLELKQYGEYRVDLRIDGEIKASIPLWIKEAVRQN